MYYHAYKLFLTLLSVETNVVHQRSRSPLHADYPPCVGRHTFATTITLSNDVPIETVSKMLGHTSLKTTQHYAKLLDVRVANDMQTLQQKLAKA